MRCHLLHARMHRLKVKGKIVRMGLKENTYKLLLEMKTCTDISTNSMEGHQKLKNWPASTHSQLCAISNAPLHTQTFHHLLFPFFLFFLQGLSW